MWSTEKSCRAGNRTRFVQPEARRSTDWTVRSQVSAFCYIFRACVSYLYIMILFCILAARHDHVVIWWFVIHCEIHITKRIIGSCSLSQSFSVVLLNGVEVPLPYNSWIFSWPTWVGNKNIAIHLRFSKHHKRETASILWAGLESTIVCSEGPS
jgi:hypothetical protein